MTSADDPRRRTWRIAVTLAVTVLALLALDDLTTDTSQTFLPERAMLVAAGVWALHLTALLVSRRRIVLAGLSSAMFMAGLWGQIAINRGTTAGLAPGDVVRDYPLAAFVAVVAALTWFAGLVIVPGTLQSIPSPREAR